ncbi:hypothetical protein ABW19_dt0203494 [Dactylella cylindrospora]|nr:hypothetical protein ABW19_dt0203494 [Dactylella cylindrospora]
MAATVANQRNRVIDLTDRVLDRTLVIELSQCLSQSGVPHVLWGNFLLSIHGIPTIVEDVSFIVDDEDLGRASLVLLSAGLKECTSPECPKRTTRIRPLSQFHSHLAMPYKRSILVFRKSETLWRLSTQDEDVKNGNIIPAHHSSIPARTIDGGMGPFPVSDPPVYIPSAAFLTDGLIRLVISHFPEDDDGPTLPYSYYLSMVNYISQYIYAKGRLDEKLLLPAVREFMRTIRYGGLGNGDLIITTKSMLRLD